MSSTYTFISEAIDQARQGLSDLTEKVKEFDATHATSTARTQAETYLSSGINNVKSALSDLAETAETMKDNAAEIPTKALAGAISKVDKALVQVREVGAKYDEQYQLSSKISATLEVPRAKVNEALSSVAAHAAAASGAANAQLQGVSDGLFVSMSKAALSGIAAAQTGFERSLPVVVEADTKYGVSEKAHTIQLALAAKAREIDDKYKVSTTATDYAEKYDVQAYANEMVEGLEGLDKKVTGGRGKNYMLAAYEAGLGLVGYAQGKYQEQKSAQETAQAQPPAPAAPAASAAEPAAEPEAAPKAEPEVVSIPAPPAVAPAPAN